MRRLVVFNMVSLDGFFVDSQGGMSWAHKNDAEWNAFVKRKCQWQRRAGVRQDYLLTYGKLLAHADGAPEFSRCRQRNERYA